MKTLSIVIPVYYNEGSLIPLYDDLKERVFSKLPEYDFDYELVMVDDGSGDNSYEVMKELAKRDEKIVTVHLSRNFGSHAAILAGLAHCMGDCAAMKAADLQEPSEMILTMLDEYKNGYNVILAVREDREEGFFQKLFANSYYAVVRRFALPNMPKGGFDCFLIDRKVVDVLNLMEEKNTTLMGQILWSGFKTKEIGYVRLKREIGKSRWTLKKKIKLFMDSLFGFSYFPIQFISSVGFVMFFASVIWALVILISKLTGNIDVGGYTALSLIMLAGFGTLLISIGVIGQYIWRMFDATRKRPPYIVEESSREKR